MAVKSLRKSKLFMNVPETTDSLQNLFNDKHLQLGRYFVPVEELLARIGRAIYIASDKSMIQLKFTTLCELNDIPYNPEPWKGELDAYQVFENIPIAKAGIVLNEMLQGLNAEAMTTALAHPVLKAFAVHLFQTVCGL